MASTATSPPVRASRPTTATVSRSSPTHGFGDRGSLHRRGLAREWLPMHRNPHRCRPCGAVPGGVELSPRSTPEKMCAALELLRADLLLESRGARTGSRLRGWRSLLQLFKLQRLRQLSRKLHWRCQRVLPGRNRVLQLRVPAHALLALHPVRRELIVPSPPPFLFPPSRASPCAGPVGAAGS